MRRRFFNGKLAPQPLLSVALVALLLGVGLLHFAHTSGAELPNRSLVLSKAVVGASDTYNLSFTLPASETLGSIELQFCQEGPLPDTPCIAPTGMDAGAASLTTQSGETGFSIGAGSNASTLVLSRAPVATTATDLSYEFNTIINPSNSGTFYGRLQTFASSDASGAPNDQGGLALSLQDAVSVSTTVPPYLYFCVGIAITNQDCTTTTGNYIDFGDFSPAATSTAETQMVAGTNGPTGYAITANGTTLTSGLNTVPALATRDVSRPGTGQFGLNLRANSDPVSGQDASGPGSGAPAAGYDVPNQYQFVSGDVVASAATPDLPREFTTTYIANIAKDQPAGIYVSTLTYVATAGF